MPPISQESGAASHRKIGGDLQGEPRLSVDAESGCGWQGVKMHGRGVQTIKGDGDNSGKRATRGASGSGLLDPVQSEGREAQERESRISGGAMEKERTELAQERRSDRAAGQKAGSEFAELGFCDRMRCGGVPRVCWRGSPRGAVPARSVLTSRAHALPLRDRPPPGGACRCGLKSIASVWD